MGDYIEVSAKTVEDAVTKALIQLETTSDKMEYVVVEKGSTGILGIFNSKPAIIKARKVLTVTDMAEEFLKDVFAAMNMEVTMTSSMDEEEKCLNIDLAGADMGVLIGKRGQTLDSLQYLVSLIINKESEEYLRVKLDTENYRERRKATLESLARNIASKVKRTKRPVSLEPMNPYERRIIHSALQNDKYVVTRSEGDEPYRHVIVSLKKESRGRYDNNRYDRPSRPYRERREYHRSEQ
ncbi:MULTISPECIES: RNA-binding cell elongation regulator Jag/EloR [unclassified Candidatus Paralachnospira]|uniref:RNA-binding cell elongation regulator Jag/EloR n=1 Tax=unclassified Candidatus Paralachnospira TaxID=3099471 RepID=UPI00302A9AC2